MKPETLAHWYVRLNGFFTVTNFVVHPRRKGSQLTDGDIVGVRFPHRAEFPDGPGADDSIFRCVGTRPLFLLAEVKRGRCELNPSWRTPPHEPVIALLQDLGPFPECTVREVTSHLLCHGRHEANGIHVMLFFIGTSFDTALPAGAPRRTWVDVISFIHERFSEYRRIKADHEQWDILGQRLWRHFKVSRSREEFVDAVAATCELR